MKLRERDTDDYSRKYERDYRAETACKHWQRKFEDYPDEPQPGATVKYLCVECGKLKEMTV